MGNGRGHDDGGRAVGMVRRVRGRVDVECSSAGMPAISGRGENNNEKKVSRSGWRLGAMG